MDISVVFFSVVLMAIIIIFGIFIGIKQKITNEAKHLLMTIIINIAMPAIILNGVFHTEINEHLILNSIIIFFISIVFNLVGIGIGWLVATLFGFHTQNAKKIAILAGLGNIGFIGIPLCATLFGPTGGLLAAIYDAGMDIIIFSIVIILLQQDRKFSFKSFKGMVNIPIMAIVIGIMFIITGFDPPQLLVDLVALLASLAAPLAMLYIGLLITEFFKRKIRVSPQFIGIALLMKLIAIPIFFIAVLQMLPITREVKQVVYILVSMPTLTISTILFAKYTKGEGEAVIVTIYSTILSLATIPLIAYLIIHLEL